ncbi:MAG: GGDEF domain-containing protein [Roseburia sp.]|nr:GGDEF domain-containing protein [Roseburia sp.]
MGKQILVMMCAINLDNQRKLLEGMIEGAKETDSNLYVFTNYISYKDKLEHVQGSYQIMQLPDFKEFDGVIMASNTIQYLPTVEYLRKAIQESGIAAVNIDFELPDMSSFCVSSYEAQIAMVEHFIKEHGAKDIVYVAGILERPEGKKRYLAYCDAMKKHGLPVKPENIYEGGFVTDGAEKVARLLLKREKLPEFIVCANDAMAAAIIDQFKEHGIRIPEDVKIAGFDDAELCELQSPSLTSVNKRQHYVGYQAVKEIHALIEGKPIEHHLIPCELVIRKSCGCNGIEIYDLDKLKDRYLHTQVETQRTADIMRNMSAEFSGMERPEELVDAVQKYIRELNLPQFYLAMCERDSLYGKSENNFTGTVDLTQVSTDYSQEITFALSYEKGEFREYGKIKKGLVLPEELRNRSGGNYYVIAPVYYQRWCYGYCVCANSRFPLESTLYYACIMNIGIGLENIRKWMFMKDTVERLNDMWIYDTMTGIYNRAGFYYHAKSVFEKWKEQNERIFIVFVDVDGLKPVNDNLGHEAGDNLIREMAEAVKMTMNENRLAMRYGGDEFVLFGRCAEGETEESILAELRANMELRNQNSQHPFKLSASLGISIYEADKVSKLAKMVEMADQKMYEEKRRKRKK